MWNAFTSRLDICLSNTANGFNLLSLEGGERPGLAGSEHNQSIPPVPLVPFVVQRRNVVE